MPAPSDKAVSDLWQHLNTYSPAGIDFYPDALRQGEETDMWPKERILDRYNQHTKHCTVCSVRAKPQHL